MNERATANFHQPRSISVMPSPGTILSRKCACGGTPGPTGECEACRKKRDVPTLQRSASHVGVVDTVPPIVHNVLRSSGQPLDSATRAFMEPRFGYDFSQVRVHVDDKAAESARSVNATAYTVNNHISFGAGHWSPTTTAGRELLAHELVHTLQQRSLPQSLPTSGSHLRTYTRVSHANDPAEMEAQSTARQIMNASDLSPVPVRVVTASLSPLLQRQTEQRDDTKAEKGPGTPSPATGQQALSQVPQPGPSQPKTIIVIGSPSPEQAYGFQFVNAALCHGKDTNTMWLVEHSGYEMIYGTSPSFITDQAPAGGYGWITPTQGLVGWINSISDQSIGRLVVYSHGVPGLVSLRYGWGDVGMPDYGLNLQDVAHLSPNKFTANATIEFNSCNTGTSTGQGNLAQEFANRSGRPVQAWTGRTSYAGVNRGTCQVQGSRYTLSTDAIAEFWSRQRAGTAPRLDTFAPGKRNTTIRCEPKYLGSGAFLGEDCIIRQGVGPKL